MAGAGSSRLAELLGADVWAAVTDTAERRRLCAGDGLIDQGAQTDCVYFIERGEMTISLRTSSGVVALGTRNAGSWVGEIGWLEPGPATAGVVATRDSVVHALARDAWLEFGGRRPDVAARLVRALSEDLARRVRHAGVVLEGPASAPASGSGWRRWLGSLFGGEQR